MLTYQLLTGRFPFWEDVRTQTLTDVWRAIMTQEIDWKAQVSEARHHTGFLTLQIPQRRVRFTSRCMYLHCIACVCKLLTGGSLAAPFSGIACTVRPGGRHSRVRSVRCPVYCIYVVNCRALCPSLYPAQTRLHTHTRTCAVIAYTGAQAVIPQCRILPSVSVTT